MKPSRFFRPIQLLFVVFSWLLFAMPSLALASTYEYSGWVSKVFDGDTVEVIDAKRKKHRIRLIGIDAPERKQRFGKASTEALKSMVKRRKVVVEVYDKDQYKRELAVLYVRNKNVNREQMRKGFAWCYCNRANPFLNDFRALQRRASKKKLGLFAQKNPIPPWKWKRTHSRR